MSCILPRAVLCHHQQSRQPWQLPCPASVAHAQDPTWQPNIQLDNGKMYKCGGAWDELYDSIMTARHMIYITGIAKHAMFPVAQPQSHPLAAE